MTMVKRTQQNNSRQTLNGGITMTEQLFGGADNNQQQQQVGGQGVTGQEVDLDQDLDLEDELDQNGLNKNGFTPEQQAKVDRIVSERLARDRKSARRGNRQQQQRQQQQPQQYLQQQPFTQYGQPQQYPQQTQQQQQVTPPDMQQMFQMFQQMMGIPYQQNQQQYPQQPQYPQYPQQQYPQQQYPQYPQQYPQQQHYPVVNESDLRVIKAEGKIIAQSLGVSKENLEEVLDFADLENIRVDEFGEFKQTDVKKAILGVLKDFPHYRSVGGKAPSKTGVQGNQGQGKQTTESLANDFATFGRK